MTLRFFSKQYLVIYFQVLSIFGLPIHLHSVLGIKPRFEVIKLFSCSTELSMQFIQLMLKCQQLLAFQHLFAGLIQHLKILLFFSILILGAVGISCSVDYEKSYITSAPVFGSLTRFHLSASIQLHRLDLTLEKLNVPYIL